MYLWLFIKNLIKSFKNLFGLEECCRNRDEIHLNLDGLEIMLERCFAYNKPHEVSIFVPRAELRKKTKVDEETVEEIEVLLNSITVVHSPQRPADEGAGERPEPPEIPREYIKVNSGE